MEKEWMVIVYQYDHEDITILACYGPFNFGKADMIVAQYDGEGYATIGKYSNRPEFHMDWKVEHHY